MLKRLIFPVCLLFSLTTPAKSGGFTPASIDMLNGMHADFYVTDYWIHPNKGAVNLQFFYKDEYEHAKDEFQRIGCVILKDVKASWFMGEFTLDIRPDEIERLRIVSLVTVDILTHDDLMKLCYPLK